MKVYLKCECGSEDFVRMYNVYNENIKVEIVEINGEECFGVEEMGVAKTHLDGYMCRSCGSYNDELNDYVGL
jgi:hypothetical protein